MIQREGWQKYLYFVPMLLLVLIIYIYPLGYSIVLSFFRYNLMKPDKIKFIWFENFTKLLNDPLALKSLLHSVQFTVYSVIGEYLVGLIIALALSSRLAKHKNINKALLMLPWAVPIAINALIWKFMLSPNFGFLNQLLDAIGIQSALQKNWLGSIKSVLPTITFINVWRSFPFYTITLSASLSSIPSVLYEAAEVDGASAIRKFFAITLPGIRNTSAVIIIFHIIWTFTNFDVIYLLTNGGPMNASEVLPTLMYREAFTYFNMGYASSIGLFLFIILFIIAGPLYSKFVISEDR